MSEQGNPTGAVFISYASQDAQAAARIYETLRTAGIEVWFDQSELRGGDAWDSRIKKQIHECALFIPVISAHTKARTEGYFRREWKLATRRLLDIADDAAFLVPVVIDTTREAEARVPEEFLHAQWTRLPDGETPPAFASRVRQLLGVESGSEHHAQSASLGQTEPSVRGMHSTRPRSRYAGGRSKNWVWGGGLALIALLLVLGGGVFWYYQRASDAPAAKAALSTPAPLAAAAPIAKSIAVLPFVNMSSDKEQEYFSDGLSEELLNLLAKIPDLRVAARTSSFYFKGKDAKLADVARELKVAHLLEGSVRKSGNRVRITAQLIRVSDGYHLWSETYDRTLEDIFAVQEEIAAAVVSQLKATLLGGRSKVRKTTPEAYALFLQAQQLDRQRTGRFDDSIALYQKVVAIDPAYAPAWRWLGGNFIWRANLGLGSAEKDIGLAREAIGKALAIEPDYASAHAALGYIELNYEHDLAASARHLEHALALDPRDPIALFVGWQLDWALGRRDKGVELMEYLVSRDPMDPMFLDGLGDAYLDAGRLDDAIGSYRAVLKLSPDAIGYHSNIADVLVLKGQYAAAVAEYKNEPMETFRLAGLACAQHALRQEQASDAALDELIAKHATETYLIATTYAYRGEADRAFEWLNKLVAAGESLTYGATDLWLKNLHDDPRWRPFLRKIGKAPEQLAAIKFELQVPAH